MYLQSYQAVADLEKWPTTNLLPPATSKRTLQEMQHLMTQKLSQGWQTQTVAVLLLPSQLTEIYS